MSDDDFHKRLEVAISGESVHSFAKRTGIPDSTMRNYLSGTMPGFDKLRLIAEATNVTLDWLVSGHGPMHRSDVPGPAGQQQQQQVTAGDLPDNMRLVPLLDVRAAAGNGSINHAEDTVGFMAFQASWLMEHGINPSFARILTAAGDSMEPTIRDGDLLVVDTSIDSLVNHGIYVLIYSGLLLVKRVTRRMDGSVLIRSDNRAAYDDEVIGANAAVDLVIAGRVRWAGRTL